MNSSIFFNKVRITFAVGCVALTLAFPNWVLALQSLGGYNNLSGHEILHGSVHPYEGSQWPIFRDQYQLKTFYPQFIAVNYPNFLATGIGARFSPNLGLTIKDAAAALGYDHFNWMQWYGPTDPVTGRIADWNQVKVDPPLYCYPEFERLFGIPCQNRDLLPTYNDEQFANDGTRIFEVNGDRTAGVDINRLTRLEQWAVKPYTLLFSDSPTENASFRTCLAGVKADGAVDIFSFSGASLNDLCFDWKASFNGTAIGLTEGFGGFPGVNISFLGFSPREFGTDELQAYARTGVGVVNMSSVPEPATYTMLLAGLGLLGFIARRRMQRT